MLPAFCAGRWYLGCIGSKVTFLYGVACLPTCLTGWVNRLWHSFDSVIVFVIVFVVINIVGFVNWVRLIGSTVFVSRNTLGFFILFLLFFKQARLIFIKYWIFLVVKR